MSKIPSTQNTKKIKYTPIPNGAYPARLVMFVGLGLQPQQDFQGKSKGPAFKAQLGFELIGQKATGVDSEGKAIEPRPSCVFHDINIFPGGERGHAFDLCKALDPSITKVPSDLEWFINKLNTPVIVTVGSYENKFKETKNKVSGIGQMLAGMQVGNAESALVGFDPYSSSDDNKAMYEKLYKFQREDLAKALDATSIPFAGLEVASTKGASNTAPKQDAGNAVNDNRNF